MESINGDFDFNEKDVEALIMPNKYISEIKQHLINCDYENNIPIIPFELIEKV